MDNRWLDPKSLQPAWDSRTATLVEMMPSVTSVLEFGAGREVTRNYLSPYVLYSPYDICKRTEHTRICNLNTDPLPRFAYHDIVMFSGVLEYVNDIPKVISHLASNTSAFVLSYACADNHSEEEQKKNGWNKCLRDWDLIEIFNKNNFRIVQKKFWKTQTLYLFRGNK